MGSSYLENLDVEPINRNSGDAVSFGILLDDEAVSILRNLALMWDVKRNNIVQSAIESAIKS